MDTHGCEKDCPKLAAFGVKHRFAKADAHGLLSKQTAALSAWYDLSSHKGTMARCPQHSLPDSEWEADETCADQAAELLADMGIHRADLTADERRLLADIPFENTPPEPDHL